ncbi:MAG TPA: AIR synthase related protein, partial [Verrucomicrobiae bacterium]
MKHSKNEDQLVRKIEGAFARPNHPGVRLGIGDDAALFAPGKGYDVVLTCDWFLEGVHFLREKHPPDAIGWKCLAR